MNILYFNIHTKLILGNMTAVSVFSARSRIPVYFIQIISNDDPCDLLTFKQSVRPIIFPLNLEPLKQELGLWVEALKYTYSKSINFEFDQQTSSNYGTG